jgi:hypothetical protein
MAAKNPIKSFSEQVEEVGHKLSQLPYVENVTDSKILIRDSTVYANCFRERELFCSLSPAELRVRGSGMWPKNSSKNHGTNDNRTNNNDKNDPRKILIGEKSVAHDVYNHHIYAYEQGTFKTEEEAYDHGKQLLDRVQRGEIDAVI